jgi:LysR family glycine cleavage system transcriptional activator
MRPPSLNSLRAFEAAARHGSFVRAADELNITPAAISHRVKSLETDLGVGLFARRTRGVVLNDTGRRYLDQIAAAFHLIACATADARRPSADGPLTVSSPASFLTLWLIPRVSRLTRRFPGLELTLQADNRLVDLRGGEADVGIRFGVGHYEGVHAEFLFGDAVAPLAPATLLAGVSDKKDTAALIARSLLLEDYHVAPSEPWMTWEPWLREAGLPNQYRRRRLRLSDAGLVVRACLDGAGACIGRLSLVNEELERGTLTLLLPWRSTEFAYHMVTRLGERQTPRIAAFHDWLVAEINTYALQMQSTFGISIPRPAATDAQ